MEGEGSLILQYISGHSVLKPQYSVKEKDIYLDNRDVKIMLEEEQGVIFFFLSCVYSVGIWVRNIMT